MSDEQSAASYIKTLRDRGVMISICDESTDEVLATAKTPELALVIKKAIENDLFSNDTQEPEIFTIRESELIRVIEYSRAQIGSLRHGNKQRGTEPEAGQGPGLHRRGPWQADNRKGRRAYSGTT